MTKSLSSPAVGQSHLLNSSRSSAHSVRRYSLIARSPRAYMAALLAASAIGAQRPFVAQRTLERRIGSPVCTRKSGVRSHLTVCQAASLQFIKGLDEPSVPDVKLTRSKDGTSGTATFVFDAPTVFESSEERGDITGLYMVDDEGEISTVDVAAKFVNGKPDRIEAKYIMRSAFEWDRFMRYMERYAEQQGLGFQKSK